MKKPNIKLGGHTVAVSSLDKIWFPKSKITKGDILEYYSHTAELYYSSC